MNTVGTQSAAPLRTEEFLLEVADVVNTTLDLNTILRRVAEIVRRVIDYEIFAILLLNEKTQELRIRFSLGHPPEVVERTRIKVGTGVTGLAAQRREPVLVNDVLKASSYIEAIPAVRSELAVPLIIKNRVIGVIDIEAPQPGYFTDEHKRLLELIGSRIAIGIENARLYTRVARQARTLGVLNEISRELTSILNLDELLKRIAETVNRLIDYQMFSVLLLDPVGAKLVHRFSLRFNEAVQLKHDIPLGKGLVGYAAEHNQAVLVADVSKDPRYIALNPETRSELVVPLTYQGRIIGVLDIEHMRRGYFTEDHMRTVTTLAAQVAIAIENARLYEQVARTERRLQKDLALAHSVQQRLLPQCCPVLGSAQLAARFVPARAIGGDLFDFISYGRPASPPARTGDTGQRRRFDDAPAGKNQLAIAVGDVSGKGAPAALYAALSSGILRSHASLQPGPAEMLARINESLGDRRIEGEFLSLIYAVWDESERSLRISNSGLPRPIYCNRGKVERIEATGIPLGLLPTTDYDEFSFHPQPGDVFVFFSDGIIDATNRDGELFGRPRVEEVVASVCGGTADDVVTAVFDAVNAFTAGADPFDDQTVVVLKVLA
ncbi:MAG TPA: GAF domain-containing protein [Terriglobales bacterium]|nr:GAF domain-containing protein [Terriglobales bacterium]